MLKSLEIGVTDPYLHVVIRLGPGNDVLPGTDLSENTNRGGRQGVNSNVWLLLFLAGRE